MLVSLLSALVIATQTPPVRQDAEVTATAPRDEAVESERFREAVAYANPMPRGAPEGDYPLVAWCEALVNGHVALGETLTNGDPLDLDIIRLGKLEAADFRAALNAAEPRQTAAGRAAAAAAAAGRGGRGGGRGSGGGSRRRSPSKGLAASWLGRR